MVNILLVHDVGGTNTVLIAGPLLLLVVLPSVAPAVVAAVDIFSGFDKLSRRENFDTVELTFIQIVSGAPVIRG